MSTVQHRAYHSHSTLNTQQIVSRLINLKSIYNFIPLISLNYSMAYISIDVVKSIVKAIAKTIVKYVVSAIARAIIIDIYKPTIDRIDNSVVRNIFKKLSIFFQQYLKEKFTAVI